jgi:serine/threonine protein kinase
MKHYQRLVPVVGEEFKNKDVVKLWFMAPETYAQQDHAIDLWSAAVGMLEMVAGKMPYSKTCHTDAGYHDRTDEGIY